MGAHIVKNVNVDDCIFHYMCRYLFLASMVVGALWDNDTLPFLGFILGAYVTAVAIYSTDLIPALHLLLLDNKLYAVLAVYGSIHYIRFHIFQVAGSYKNRLPPDNSAHF